jgi:branched-chain amino acid transport system substrate-binding protein
LRPTGKVTYFRIATTDDHQGPANADYLYKTGKYKKAYVVDDAETYGIGIANTFSDEWKKLGGTLLGRASEPSTTTSFVSLLTQIASKQPDVIYFGGTDSTGGVLMKQQMSQVPALKNTTFAGGDGIVSQNFAKTIGMTGGLSTVQSHHLMLPRIQQQPISLRNIRVHTVNWVRIALPVMIA